MPIKSPLAQAILDLKTPHQVEEFLIDMLTSSEYEVLVERWNVAVELAKVQAGASVMTQRQIAESRGVSQKFVGNVKEHVYGRHGTGVAKRFALRQARVK